VPSACARPFVSDTPMHVRARTTHEIRVPHADRVADRDLPHEQAVHPAERELHKFDALRAQVFVQRRVNARDEFGHASHRALDPRLRGDVVFLYAVEQTREAPERVGLDGRAHALGQQRHVRLLRIRLCGAAPSAGDGARRAADARTEIRRQEDLEERRREVVDALHVAARRVADRPDVEDALETLRSARGERTKRAGSAWRPRTRCVAAHIQSGTPGRVRGTSISI
jgi:hypothetical protein